MLTTLVAALIFGISVSVAGYGLYLPLLLILIIRFVIDLCKKKPGKLPILDIGLYFAYIIIFYICTLFNGDDDLNRNSLIINYLVCIFIYVVLSKDVINRNEIDNITNVLLVLLIFNCIVTVLQYHNNPLGWGIWYIFNDIESVSQAGLIENMDAGSQTLGKNFVFCPGIFPSQVYNGYIVGSLSPLVLYQFHRAKKIVYKLFFATTLLLIIYSLIVIQQRMAFFLFMVVFTVVMFSKNRALTLLLSVALILVYLLYGLDLSEDQFGRLIDVEDKTREHLYTDGFDYIINHFLVGGRKEFAEIHNLSVHNVFLNAFMYGGVFGASLIIIIFIRMCVSSLKLIVQSLKNGLTMTSMLAYALLIFNLISMTHNNSLLTGDAIIWVLYGMMLLSFKFEKYGSKT